MRRAGVVMGVAGVLAGMGCTRSTPTNERPIGAVAQLRAPLGLPPVPVLPDNPVTVEAVALGRTLFYDRRLSGDDSVSCASCHDPRHGFADARKVSVGMQGRLGTRNAPTVLNSAYASLQFWDGRAATLEDQAAVPIANPAEMNQTHRVSVDKLARDPQYVAAFARAFGPGPITIGKIQRAIASFERTALSGNSPFDRHQFGGDKTELSPAAVRGLTLFRDPQKGDCAECHTIQEHYALFTDGKFHNLGVGMDAEGELTDLGRYQQTKVDADKGAFRTPSLRNVALSAPYMHDGSLRSLRDVVDFYAGGGNSNPYLDKRIRPLSLTRAERDDLVAFLQSLTGEQPRDVGPPGGK